MLRQRCLPAICLAVTEGLGVFFKPDLGYGLRLEF